jgi:16S rRNA C967 or C1407 C5-methylase (RsmB/RsmF family)
LLYATCSVFNAEGRGVIGPFLRDHRDAKDIPLATNPRQSPGRATDSGPGLQLLPASAPAEDHDGFFYCLLEKRRP